MIRGRLVKQDFQAADLLTIQQMCEVAEPKQCAENGYISLKVENFPIQDLQTINSLWLAHSQGKFGFSVQRELWLGQAMNFGKSKARVQMEPQTQVTFGDVAGIDQAKLELNEVVDFFKKCRSLYCCWRENS